MKYEYYGEHIKTSYYAFDENDVTTFTKVIKKEKFLNNFSEVLSMYHNSNVLINGEILRVKDIVYDVENKLYKIYTNKILSNEYENTKEEAIEEYNKIIEKYRKESNEWKEKKRFSFKNIFK